MSDLKERCKEALTEQEYVPSPKVVNLMESYAKTTSVEDALLTLEDEGMLETYDEALLDAIGETDPLKLAHVQVFNDYCKHPIISGTLSLADLVRNTIEKLFNANRNVDEIEAITGANFIGAETCNDDQVRVGNGFVISINEYYRADMIA